MALNNIVLLPSTQGLVDVTGQPVRANGSTRAVGSLYTVALTANNYRGRIYIEGSLATNPNEDDWFAVIMPGLTTGYIDYPESTTGMKGFNFKGNFTWIRARQERSHLAVAGLNPSQLAVFGAIDSVVLNSGSWNSEQNLSTSPYPTSGLDTIRGNNLGTGTGLYTGSLGQANTILNFRSIVPGPGIVLEADAQTLTISSTGSGGGSTPAPQGHFVDLSDTPGEIVTRGVLIGGAFGALEFAPVPTAVGQYLTSTATGAVWTNRIIEPKTVVVQNEGYTVKPADTINFTGDGVSVASDANGIVTVTIAGLQDEPSLPERTEYAILRYTAGNSGNMSASDAVTSTTSGVTATVVDPTNCIVSFTFQNRAYPPLAIAVMGHAYSANEFVYANVNPTLQTRKIAGGGSSDNPTLMGSFSGPITLQLRMSDTGASAGAGLRSRVIVMFRF